MSVGCYEEEFRVIEELEEAYAPVEKFQRMKAVLLPDGTYQAVTEEVPVRTVDPQERRANEMPETLDYTGIRDISWWMCWIRRFPWRSLLHRSVKKI